MKAKTRTTLTAALLLGAMILSETTPGDGAAAGSVDVPEFASLDADLVSHSTVQTAHVPELELPSALIGTATIYAETVKQVEMAAWATERFAAAGLELPPVTIHMHTSRADCSIYPEYIRNGFTYRSMASMSFTRVTPNGPCSTSLATPGTVWRSTTPSGRRFSTSRASSPGVTRRGTKPVPNTLRR